MMIIIIIIVIGGPEDDAKVGDVGDAAADEDGCVAYEVGEAAEIVVLDGEAAGTWLRCAIVALGANK